MGSVLAIVSKAVFERFSQTGLGDVLAIDRYTSTHASLATLADGGSLFLVTVRPPDEALWLVAVLDDPTLAADGWHAGANTVAITDISALRSRLRFASGTGIQAKKGALGMSLQTPRVLAAEDVALLRGAAPATSMKSTKAAARRSAAQPVTAAAKRVSGEAVAPTSALVKAATPARTNARDGAGDPIAAVRAAITAKDAIAALDAALVAWRAQRAAPLAELVEALGVRVTGPATPEHAWAEVAASRDPVHLGSLVRRVPELPVSFLPAAADLLAKFPDDPRLATAIAAWALDPLTTSSSTYPFWTRSLDTLVRIGDARVIPTLQKRLKMPQIEGKFAGANKPSKFWPRFYTAIEKAIAKLAALPAVTVDRKAIAGLTAAAKKLQIAGTPAPRTPRSQAAASVPAAKGPPLAQAVAHANAGRIAPAIEALVAAWRLQRAPELADRIDRATRLLPTYDRPFPVEPKAMHAAWMQAIADDPIGSLPRLLQHVDCGGAGNAERQIVALAALPDDPRTALRLAEIAGTRTVSPERTQYWKSLWEIVARIADVRVAAPLNRQFGNFEGTYYNHHRQGRRILGDLVASPPPPPALDTEAHKLVNQLDAALGKLEAARDTTERDLIAAIARDWRDDGPRLVYADWLTEREHPRGEVIVLACKPARSAAETKRYDQLVGGYRERTHIFGPLSDLAPQLDRGLPGGLRVDNNASTFTWRHVAGDPLLPVVETIAIHLYEARLAPLPEDLARVLLDPTAQRLAQVTGVPGELGDALVPLLGKRWTRKADTLVRA